MARVAHFRNGMRFLWWMYNRTQTHAKVSSKTGGRKLFSRFDLHKAIGCDPIGRCFSRGTRTNTDVFIIIIIIIAMLYYTHLNAVRDNGNQFVAFVRFVPTTWAVLVAIKVRPHSCDSPVVDKEVISRWNLWPNVYCRFVRFVFVYGRDYVVLRWRGICFMVDGIVGN